MENAKKLKIAKILFFLFLIIFPFGQILRFPFHPLDLVVGLAFLLTLIFKFDKPPFFRYFQDVLLIFAFGFLLSVFVFGPTGIAVGALYLLRLVAYIYFFVFCLYVLRHDKYLKQNALNFLLLLAVVVGIFGWIQYIFWPDLRALLQYGWDEHLYRLVGSFLDPAFTGIILALGALVAITKKRWIASAFLLLSILFTYSRASYLSLVIGLLALGFMLKKFRTIFLIIFCFLIAIVFLPRRAGEGVKLERTSSIILRIDNYNQGLTIFKKYPLFGVGYNNICLLKKGNSHSCSGFDSSFLTILASSGILGFISAGYLIYLLFKTKGYFLFKASVAAVLVHSFFANSLFYPWVMAWLGILAAGEYLRGKSNQ